MTTETTLSPWAFFGVDAPPACGVPPTGRQRAMLKRAGVPVPTSKRQASTLIGAIIGRTKAGLCTYRQAVCLLRGGARVEVRTLTFGEAQYAIGEMVETEPGDALGIELSPTGGVW